MNPTAPQESKCYLTMAEYADATGISLSTIKRLKLRGKLPFIQEGRLVRIPTQATDHDWLEQWRLDKGIRN